MTTRGWVPCARSRLAAVWRSEWNGMAGNPAALRTDCNALHAVVTCIGWLSAWVKM
jgi:hypothetical protein